MSTSSTPRRPGGHRPGTPASTPLATIVVRTAAPRPRLRVAIRTPARAEAFPRKRGAGYNGWAMGDQTRTYRVKLYPSRQAHHLLDDTMADQARLYNAALEHRREAWRKGRNSVSFVDQSRELTGVRQDDPRFAALNRTIQVGTLRRLDKAYKAFFRRVKAGEKPGYPRFKSARRWHTLICDNNVQARSMVKVGDSGNGTLRIKGLPPLPFKGNRELPPLEQLVELRVVRTARRVVAHLVYTQQVEDTTPPASPQSPVGVDLGVHSLLALSDGTTIGGLRDDRRRERRLRRRVSRARLGSRSRRKKVKALSRETQKRSERRAGRLHEVSRALVNTHDFIAMEDLAVANMTRSAKGTTEAPGRNVRAKSGLNRSILAQGWGVLTAQIRYKAESAGVGFVVVPPHHTSQECSGCGAIVQKALSVRVHRCTICGLTLDRDVNAALNVLRRGLLAYGDGGNQAVAPAARSSSTETTAQPMAARSGRRRKPRAQATGGPPAKG